MQGQRDAIGSLSNPINLGFGSISNNVAMDQQIGWNNLHDPTKSRLETEFVDPVSQEAQNMTRWSIGESSTTNSQTIISHDDRMEQSGWSSSRNVVSLDLNITQIPNGPFASYDNSNGDPMDCSNLLEHRLFPSSCVLEPPFASSSGTRDFLVGDNDYRLDDRRLSSKRKMIEGNIGQSSSSSASFFSSESSMSQAILPSLNSSPQLETSRRFKSPDPINSGIELSTLGFASDALHTSNVGSSIMNIPNHQDSLSSNSCLPWATAEHSNVPPDHQSLGLVPVNPPPEVVPPPIYIENAQLFGPRRNSHRRSRAGTTEEGDASLHEDLNIMPLPRNIFERPMFMPSSELSSIVTHNSFSNWIVDGNAAVFPRHVGSGSSVGVGSTSNFTSGRPSWGSSRRHPSFQYSRRMSEFVSRSLLSSSQSELVGSSSSAHRSVPSTSQDAVRLSGGRGQHRHSQPSSRSSQWMDRHVDGGDSTPYSVHALSTASEGRGRLVIEHIHNFWGMMSGGEGLQIEDVMAIGPSVIFEMADVRDQHRDMRLDVDNMSYEELLALEERIGSVSTGLSAEVVTARMKQRKFFSIARSDQAEAEPCCICQEEYSNGDDLGTLDCDHDFHSECIRQWLEQKNMCPICKTTALIV